MGDRILPVGEVEISTSGNIEAIAPTSRISGWGVWRKIPVAKLPTSKCVRVIIGDRSPWVGSLKRS